MKSNQQTISVLQGMMKSTLLLCVLAGMAMFFWPDAKQTEVVYKATDIVIKEGLFILRPDYIQVELVSGRPLFIVKYSEADKACLNMPTEQSPIWFVAWAQGRDLACPLKSVNATEASASLGYQVCRSLQDQCWGSLYSLQGKVYASQLAKQDLLLPQYTIKRSSDRLTLRIISKEGL